MTKRKIIIPSTTSKIFIFEKGAAKHIAFYEGKNRQKWLEYNKESKNDGSYVLAHALYTLEKGNGDDNEIIAEIKSFNNNSYRVKRSGEIVIKLDRY